MGQVDVLLGLQWGDEGKGCIVDRYAPNYRAVARFQGGPNAGHTLETNGQKTVLHLIPSGVLRGIPGILASKVILDLNTLITERRNLRKRGFLTATSDLAISGRCPVITRYQLLLDRAREVTKGKKAIGTTLKGIGPGYEALVARQAILLEDIFKPDFGKIFRDRTAEVRALLETVYWQTQIPSCRNEIRRLRYLAEQIKGHVVSDISAYVQKILEEGDILAEGAQGALLDISQGTYPYVTSSDVNASTAAISLGVGPQSINRVTGIFKAYTTRVGNGGFDTELKNGIGAKLAQAGQEFGSTTGRPRRCGWLSIPDLKKTIRLNGVNELVMTKLDVLAVLDNIRVFLGNSDCEYMDFPSFNSLNGCRRYEDLPVQAREYLTIIQNWLGVPIKYVGIGPDRDQYVSVPQSQ